jgi:prepilin-type N-terminal cleavage/methylation domain-containing protein
MRKGFTVLEVLLVVVVLAILASMAFGLMHLVESRRIDATKSRVLILGQAVAKYQQVKGYLPPRLEDLAPKTLDEPDWMNGGKFVDSWDRPIEYAVLGNEFKLWSCGPDGVSGTLDDLRYKNR